MRTRRFVEYERIDPPEPKPLGFDLKYWCDGCGEKRPCTCDKEADAHIAEQEEEEYLRTQKLEEERAKAPCENCGKKLCKCDSAYEEKIENEMRRYEE